MEETVNIPLLVMGAMRRRGCDTTACRRNCRLKGVGVEGRRKVHALIRT